MNIYWGDLHNHCNITYGHGDLQSAFEAAKEQLDFVSVTPHAMWPDMPTSDDPRLQWVINYHLQAFEKLKKSTYTEYLQITKQHNRENEFLTFVGYECHSMQYGDHVVLCYHLDEPLTDCTSIEDLKEKLKHKKVFITPHHMGYQQGYRGYDWKFFTQNGKTPFIEIFSRHGLAESDQGDYPYLHDMGPRCYTGSALYGLEHGYKVGFIGSTDQHAGYPGSYGDGRVAVLAPSLTRDAIWEALQNRHCYCSTGARIIIDFRINHAIMGDCINIRNSNCTKEKHIALHVETENYIDYIDIIKNGKCFKRINGLFHTEIPQENSIRAKLKINFGWNRTEKITQWNTQITISDGIIENVTPCFRGSGFTSPQEHTSKETEHTLVNRIRTKTAQSVELEMYTKRNPNTLTPCMQGVVLNVTMPKNGIIRVAALGKIFEHSMQELLEGAQVHFFNGWLSEAIQFERACPEQNYTITKNFIDTNAERKTDYYYIRVRQKDGQAAWSSPIWVSYNQSD